MTRRRTPDLTKVRSSQRDEPPVCTRAQGAATSRGVSIDCYRER
jgi:hypothetical protein